MKVLALISTDFIKEILNNRTVENSNAYSIFLVVSFNVLMLHSKLAFYKA